MSEIRMDRINEEIKKAVGDIMLHEINDPRMSKMTSVVSVDTSRDLAHSHIKVSIYGDTKNAQRTMDVLKRSAGFIARGLGRRVELRRVPQLHFIQDTSIEYGIHMSELIDSIKSDGDS